ncbi:MAG: DUF3078 domain-containing protein, partial [Tannerella sp.]|nr:DUF3078 domain-containing protein [Tannerella sp.]
IAFLCLIFNANAQEKKPATGLPPEVMSWTKSTLDSLSYKQYKSLKDAMRDNNFYIPLVFRGGMFPKLDFKPNIRFSESKLPSPYKLESKAVKNMFQSYLLAKLLQDNAYREVMLKDPANFQFSFDRLPGYAIKPANIEKPVSNVKVEVGTASVEPEQVEKIVKFIPDRKYWTSSFAVDLKFTQNKSTSNWFNGEIDNMNIVENIIISYNYAKDNITLTNTLSNNTVVNNAPNDTVHFYTLGSNDLRLRSNFGLRAIGNWSYSASGEFVTPILNKYIANSNDLNSTFLSPYTINLGLGMTFAKTFKFKSPNKSWSLNLSVEPLAFKYMYSKNKNIDLPAYFPRNPDGSVPYVLRTFGSQFTLNNNPVKFNKFIELAVSRLYYFTNYERVMIDFENKLNIKLSRYFSTSLHLYLRYDDAVAKSPDSDTYLQVYELFSFGFNYQW